MTQIINGAIVFDADELAWWAENYGDTEWAVYFAGMNEITTHDRHYPGDEVKGEPFTKETVRAYLAEFDRRFGPGSPMDREVYEPSYAVALHHGVPAFGSHEHSFGDCVCGTSAAALLVDFEAEAKRERESAAVWRRRAYQVGNELILQKSPELAPYLGEFTDEQTADAEAFIENTALRAQLADALELLGARADGSPHIVETTIGLDPFSPDAPHWTVHHPLQCHRLSYGEGCEFDVAVDRWGLKFPIEVGRYEVRVEEYDGVPGAELMLERLDGEAVAR